MTDSTEPDRLQRLFNLQEDLQSHLGVLPGMIRGNVPYTKEMILACTDELHEALREIPWKSWKENQSWNEDAFKKEVIDAWHFMINITLASGMTVDEFFERFNGKNQINHDRKTEGY